MWFSSVLSRLRRARPRKFLARLDVLEGRLAPAIFSVTSLADSNAAGSGSLRRAITDSNATAGSNVINILTPGTYALTLNGANDDNTAGDLDVLRSVTIQNQSGGSVVLDAGGLNPGDRVLDLAPTGAGVNVTVMGVTIQGGNTTGGGGGIRSQNGSNLVLIDDVLQNNVAGSAGGGGLLQLGGGDLTITNCLVANNTAGISQNGFGGGGVRVENTDNVTITGSQFFHNTTPGDGGGLLYFSTATTLTIASSTFAANNSGPVQNAVGGLGGGLDLSTTVAARLTNVTVSGNTASEGGGLAYASGGTNTVTLRNCTVAFNTATDRAGGILSNSGANEGSVTLVNTIVARNTAGVGGHPDVDNDNLSPGNLVDGGHNLIGSDDGAPDSFPTGTPNAQGSLVGPIGIQSILIDPLLGPLADNGGAAVLPDGSHVLTHDNGPVSGNNGARDRGTDTGAPGADARGFARRADAHVDIGAFEFQDFDVAVRADAPAVPVHAGLPTTVTFTVTNNGPGTARGVTLNATLPNGMAAGAILVKVVPIDVPDLAPGVSVTRTLTVTPAAPGPFTVSAALGSHDDPNLGNNTSAVTLAVLPQPFPTTGFADVTARLQVVLQGRRAGRRVAVVVTNAGGTPIQGPLGLVVARLPRGVRLRNAAGRVGGRQPFVRLDAGGDNILDPGERASTVLVFSGRFRPRQLRVLAGAFA